MAAAAPHASDTDPGRDAGGGFARLLADAQAGKVAAPLIMGVVNVTPDSFSDGGHFFDTMVAAAHGRALIADGAAILDIGGESTRLNAAAVSAEEEARRILPVITELTDADALLSVDTMKATIAETAIAAGVHIINDIRGLQGDPNMAAVVARTGAGVVAMHNPGLHGSAKPLPGDPIAHCLDYFHHTLEIANAAGIATDRIVLDPGFGFGKSVDQNLELLARLPELMVLGQPILVGTSRKSFIGKITGRDVSSRLVGTLVTNIVATMAGAAILRVHDVTEHVEATRVAAAIRAQGEAADGAGGAD